MPKLEFAGLGFFFTLGNITPRFLEEDRFDDHVPGLAVELGKLPTLLELFDQVEEDVDIDTDETMVVGETVVSARTSSESPTCLKRISNIALNRRREKKSTRELTCLSRIRRGGRSWDRAAIPLGLDVERDWPRRPPAFLVSSPLLLNFPEFCSF